MTKRVPHVLIDDDEIVHQAYKRSARRFGVELHCFRSVDEFLTSSHRSVSKQTRFLVDQELGGRKKGHQQARDLHRRGFHQLIIVTAYPEGVPAVNWIQEIRGKFPPIWEES
jgi:FixJ family two-component response regulator